MDPILGTIILFGGTFEPKGWAFCNGQLLSIAENSALYSLLGTTYGGDGITSFALPDLRGRVPVHAGKAAGLTPRSPGQSFGDERVTLGPTQVPSHSHDLIAANVPGDTNLPAGALLARSEIYADAASVTVPLNALSISPSGGGQPHDNMQPSLCINYIIAVDGVYPSRN
jgi:microcystin-dependent protein